MFNLFDFDNDKLPQEKFDIIISLYSLDYHYNFNIYKDYLDKVMKSESILIFDTIRPDFLKLFLKKLKSLSKILILYINQRELFARINDFS